MSTITFTPLKRLNPVEFLDFTLLNQGLICEMNTNGSIILKTLNGKKYARLIEKILKSLHDWNDSTEEGIVLDRHTGYILPNGAIRHPSVSWVKKHKIASQTEHLLETAPDFFIECVTESDTMNALKMRMKEYMLNGALLGWLIDVNNEKVHIYKIDGSEEIIEGFKNTLSGGSILRGYVFQWTINN
jgi:Uma2 family endonuclease